MTSVDMLTTFATKCDAKLENCSVRIQKMEAALVLVEKKLGNVQLEASVGIVDMHLVPVNQDWIRPFRC